MNSEQARQELIMLVDYFAGIDVGKVEFWTILAQKLSTAAGREKPWSWQYIRGVYKDQLAPSKELGRAIRVLGAMIDDVPALIANTESITILALPGSVQPGSLVMIGSQMCAKPGCRTYFVPNHPRRIYCPACSPPTRKESKK